MRDEPRLRSIGEVASIAGLSVSAIRFYERKGVVKPVRSKARRLYAADDILKLKLATRMRAAGFSVASIAAAIGRQDLDSRNWSDGLNRCLDAAFAEAERHKRALDRLSEIASCECAAPARCRAFGA